MQQILLDKALLNSDKFSLSQATSNSVTGKTSGSGTIGLYWGFIIGISFILGVIDKMCGTKTPDILLYTLSFATIDAALLGIRKIRDSKGEIEAVSLTDQSDNKTDL